MKPGFSIALGLLAAGCQFSVPPIELDGAIVEPSDLSADAGDDLTPPPDLLTPPADLTRGNGESCSGDSDCASMHCANSVCVECVTSAQCGAPLQFCVENACDPLSTGLVAYWKLNEPSWIDDCATPTVVDSSGNNHGGHDCPARPPGPGNPPAAGPTPGMPGKFGSCGSFGPMEQHIDVPADPAFNTGTGDFTISLWAWFNMLGADTPVFESLSADTAHQVLMHHQTTGWSFEQRPPGGANTVLVAQTRASTTTNAWHHLALVRSGNSWTIYLDGVSVASATNANAMIATTGLVLGWSLDNANQLNGKLDDYRFYSRALSPAEITAFSL